MSAGEKSKVGAWLWTEWPTWAMPTEDYIRRLGTARGARAVDEYHRARELNILNEQNDPLQYGWEQPPLKVVRALLAGTYVPGQFGQSLAPADWKQPRPANDIVFLGGNGSGKTEVEAKLAMEILEGKPGSEARCWSQNEGTSVRYIQKAMYKYMRPAFRKVKSQGITTKISYKESTGFSEGVFILPSHSTALFPTYKGWEQDPKSAEGGEADVITWDEEIPAKCIKTLRFRAAKKGGVVLGGFTPVDGYTATVAEYIEGGRILETIPARAVVWDWWQRTWAWGDWILDPTKALVKGCPKGHVPFVIESGQGNGRRFAVTFPTMFNPYTNVQAIIDESLDGNLEYRLMRLWGYPTKLAHKAFPNFTDVHIVEPERVPALDQGTVWFWTDPHGGRNWFMNWTLVLEDGTKYTFKEWPDGEIGDWAVPGEKPDGGIGPAQTFGGGKGFNDYKRLILEAEGWVIGADGVWTMGPKAFEVFDRKMDPRPAGTSVPSDEEARTYLDHMSEAITSGGKIILPGLDFQAGADCGIEEGKGWVNNWINEGWNPNQPVNPLNMPKWFISKRCPNTIWALKTYTGVDGLKGACKDPIDCLKGLSKSGIRHMPKGSLGSYGGGFGY